MGINNHEQLEQAVQRIQQSVDRFNRENVKPYLIDFAMGYAVYEHESKMTADVWSNKKTSISKKM